ncbi:MAG: AAA family ATPase [Chthoniobacterales bacterium]|nr:AAA family ATPase [Chthoniobacterales bacterium]
MIKRFKVQNYKALRDVSLDLTPIHVLIGPNDSGKTSLLEAIAALCRSVDHDLSHAFTGAWDGEQLIWHRTRDLPIAMSASIEGDGKEFEYRISFNFPSTGRGAFINEEVILFEPGMEPLKIGQQRDFRSQVFRAGAQNETASSDVRRAALLVHDSLRGVHSYRWDSRFLGLPVAPDRKRRFRMEPSGFGLALCLDDILGYDRDRFIRLESRFKQIFPQFKSIQLIPEAAFRSPTDDPEAIPMLQRADGKGIYFEFATGGQRISAHQVSDGVLLVLAYLTILNLPEPPRVLLIEEPENGIHPKRLRDVLGILRDLVSEQNRTQVVMTTHSPYVVDLFQPEEVTICQKQQDGAVSVRRLSESRPVRDQRDVFTLGEIWTAEGDEALATTVASGAENSE